MHYFDHHGNNKGGAKPPVIKVLGAGNCGINAIQHLKQTISIGAEFISIDTDYLALQRIKEAAVIKLEPDEIQDLALEVDSNASSQTRASIAENIDGADLIILIAGMGGNTGTVVATTIAEEAKKLGIFVIAVVTTPFSSEGSGRIAIAEKAIWEIKKHVKSPIIIQNENRTEKVATNFAFDYACKSANDMIYNTVKNIIEVIQFPYFMCLDLIDVMYVLNLGGLAVSGTGTAAGVNRARRAIENALRTPLLAEVNLMEVSGVLVIVKLAPDFGSDEISDICRAFEDYSDDDATLIVGVTQDDKMEDKLQVTVIVVGLGEPYCDTVPFNMPTINQQKLLIT